MRKRRIAAAVAVIVSAASMAAVPAHASTSSHGAVKPSASTGKLSASPADRTFSSPALNARRVGAGASARAATSRTQSAATGGATIYAGNPEKCVGTSTDAGTGTAANPYCSIQDAVNAAAAGDVISIANGAGYNYGPVTITTSDLTLDAPTGATISNTVGGPGLVLNGASDVTLSDLGVSSYTSDALVIEASTGIDFDSGGAFVGGGTAAISIDGASSGITISRTQLTLLYGDEVNAGISIASGASDIDLASNVLADFQSGGVAATGVSGLDVVGNTIQRSCDGAVTVTGGSTAVSIENNVFIDISSSNCSSGNLTWQPDVTVDATSAAGTTSDYNDFALYGSTDTDGTAPYSWASTTYASLSAFRSATSQGAHDTDDTTTFGEFNVPNTWWNMEAVPAWGSPAVYSANLSAPGAMTTDLRGKSPYNTRGALQYQGPFPTLNETTSLTQTGPYSISVSEAENYAPSTTTPFTVTFDWGDGTKYTQTLTQVIDDYSEPHTYSAYGSYTVTVTLTDNKGDTVTKTLAVDLSAPDPDLSLTLETAQTGAYTTQLSISSPEPAGLTYGLALNETIGWGDGTTSTSDGAYVGGTYTISHTYKSTGNYAVTVSAVDAGGDTAQGSIAVTETDPDPNLAAGLALTGSDTSAHGISVDATSADPGLPYSLALTDTFSWGDGTTSTVSTTAGTQATASHTYTAPGSYTVTVEVTDAVGDNAENSMQVTTAGSDYTAYGPARLLDTRDGTGGVSKPLTSTAPIKLKVAGNGSIPADVTAVAMNVTVTESSGSGNVAVNPDGVTPSGTSNLNYGAGQTVANMVIVPVGTDGYVSFTKQGPGSVAVIADVAGYYTQTAAAGYTASSPTRILDTRNGTGGVSKPLTSTAPIKLKVAGNGSIPANITAVAVNLTLTSATGSGNVVAYPDGTTQPTASNLNYSAGQTVANAAIVPVHDGYIDLAKQGPGAVAMIVDVNGYFSPTGTGAYLPVTPTREFDSRDGSGKLAAEYSYDLPLDQDSSGTVLPGVTALVLNSTVTNVTGTGFLTVFPDNTDGTNGEPLVPNASNLNFGAGETVPNLTFATPGSDGVVDFYNGARTSSLDLIVDIFGYYQND